MRKKTMEKAIQTTVWVTKEIAGKNLATKTGQGKKKRGACLVRHAGSGHEIISDTDILDYKLYIILKTLRKQFKFKLGWADA